MADRWTDDDERLTQAADVPGPSGKSEGEETWARDMLGRLVFANLAEQRRGRRWGIFFKFLFFVYLTALVGLLIPADWRPGPIAGEQHTAYVRVDGIIAPGAKANADDIIDGVTAAFEHPDTAAVVLRINSPGGSPVQSDIIYGALRRLRDSNPDIPLYAVIEDMGASGAYYVAVGADEIYANRSSIVGSIGVRSGGFGFTEAIERLGIERRLYTAGKNKALLDPFLPSRPDEVARLQEMLDAIHTHFIDAVMDGRGDRLDVSQTQIFSGLIWTGDEAQSIGLVDGIGDIRDLARERIGVQVLVDFTRTEDVFSRLSEQLGAAVASAIQRLGWGARMLP
jgi:protease-4